MLVQAQVKKSADGDHKRADVYAVSMGGFEAGWIRNELSESDATERAEGREAAARAGIYHFQ